MARVRRSLPVNVTCTGISSIASTYSLSKKSVDSCSLCVKLCPATSYRNHNFTSLEMIAAHANSHTDQERKINNIFNKSTIQPANQPIIEEHRQLMFRKCFCLSSAFQKDVFSVNNRSENEIESDCGTVSLIFNSDQSKWSGFEKLRTMATVYRCRACCRFPLCENKRLALVDEAFEQLRFNEIILHATKHLCGIDFYSCRLCDYSTNLIENMQQHHFQEHLNIEPANSKSHYFTANYSINKSTILKTIKQCFGLILINCESKFAESETIHESPINLRLILLKKLSENKKLIQCQKCSKSLNVIGYKNGWNGKQLLVHHAQTHLINKPILRCTFCDVTKPSYETIKFHLKSKHSNLLLSKSILNYYVDESTTTDNEIDQMLYECFQKVDKNQQHRIHRFWLNLRKKIGSRKRIRCAVCLTCISTKTKNNFHMNSVMQHALLHLPSNLPIYKCNLCSEFSVSNAMNRHFSKCHSDIDKSEWRRHYQYNRNQFEPEIVSIAKKCFEYENIVAPKKLNQKSIPTINLKLTGKFQPEKGQVESFCDELMNSSTNEFNRLECKICTKEIAINSRRPYVVITNHAIIHTDLPLHTCSICDFKSVKYHGMKRHLVEQHQSIPKLGQSYHRHSTKFQTEIILALKKCFQKC